MKGTKLTQEQEQMLRNYKFEQLRKELFSSVSVTAGFSSIIHISFLLKDEIYQYAASIGKDVTWSVAISTTSAGLENCGMNSIAPATGLILSTLWDTCGAFKTGDLSHVGLNFAVNSCAFGAALVGGKSGALLLTAVMGPWGTMIGGVVGSIVGSVSTNYYLKTKTPLGTVTATEEQEFKRKLAEKLRADLEQFGLELNTDLDLKTIYEQLQENHIPFTVTRELAEAKISIDNIKNALGKGTVSDILRFASLSQEGRLHGLKEIKRAMGC